MAYGDAMVATRARHPQLIELSDPPMIKGQRCRRCRRTAFPPDPYGCEQCGAELEDLAPVALAASGTIHAVATVHRHHNPQPETPFTVATIVLDDEVTLKGVLDGDGSQATIGQRVEGVLVPFETSEDGAQILDLRFRLLDGAS